VPEQPTMSIKVSMAPQIAGGLHSLVQNLLTSASEIKTPKGRGSSDGSINNEISGTVHGTVFQIGRVNGDMNDNRGR
jgi:hypothetical protein